MEECEAWEIMKKINIKRVLLTVLLILGTGVILFVFWFVRAIFTDDTPEFFPLNNSKARYTIMKSSKVVQGNDEKEATNSYEFPQPNYYVEYRGDSVWLDDTNNKFFRIIVGNSKVDLEPFIGKDVMITKGKFVGSSKQCIVNKCIDIGPYAVLDIYELKVVK